jgi:hypothetical protein
MEERKMIFDVHLDTEGVIRNAIESKIYLGGIIDSLNTAVIDVPNEANTSDDVLRKYEAFFEVLRKELEERGIEKVEIGMALDVTGCEIARTIEMTPSSIFICENDRREASKLTDIFGDIYPPEHIIGRVVHAITRQQNKVLIDRLESGVKYVKDLVTNRTPEESDNTLCDKKRIDNDDHHAHMYDDLTSGVQTDTGRDAAAFPDGKRASELKENGTDNNNGRGPSK